MLYITIFIFLLIFSAFFSGSETAYFNLRQNSNATPKELKSILAHPRRLLVSILTGNTIVNVAIASLAALITTDFVNKYNWDYSINSFGTPSSVSVLNLYLVNNPSDK